MSAGLEQRRDFAWAVVCSTDLETKLGRAPAGLRDDLREGPLPEGPGRPPGLRIRSARKAPRTPSIEGMHDPLQRGRILHALANHELQATELYAWAILAFPEAPAAFRDDLMRILADEQRHTRMYVSRLRAHGLRFGDLPVTGYFWNKLEALDSPLRFACAMALTFENANLDHSVDYAEAARQAGDQATAAVIDRVHLDERRHVRFGWTWLGRFKRPEESMWQAYVGQLKGPVRASLARGKRFHAHGRLAAGLDPEFVRLLEAQRPERSRDPRRRRDADASTGWTDRASKEDPEPGEGARA